MIGGKTLSKCDACTKVVKFLLLPQITFVSGEWVKVTDFRSYLNVEIQVTGSEFGNTSGLCGTFDNNTHNDMTAPDGRVFPFNPVPRGFTESWR